MQVDANLRELYRRVAYNICIGNSDDHFRNHGFLLTSKGWTLSPAYGMNPTLNDHQSLLISASSDQSDLSILLDAYEEYMLDAQTAKQILIEKNTVLKPLKIQPTNGTVIFDLTGFFQHFIANI